MKRSIFTTTMICLLVAVTMAAPIAAQSGHASASSQSPTPHPTADADLTVLVQQLSQEVKTLKLEVLKLQVELQQSKVTQWEHELEKTQAEKRQAEVQEREITHELAELEEHLSLASLTPEERAELSAAK